LILPKKNIYSIFGFDVILETDFVFAAGQGICFVIRLTGAIYDVEIIIREYFGLVYLPRNFFCYKIFKGFMISIDSDFLISHLKLKALFIQDLTIASISLSWIK
jgi:hypothetical protein